MLIGPDRENRRMHVTITHSPRPEHPDSDTRDDTVETAEGDGATYREACEACEAAMAKIGDNRYALAIRVAR